MSMTMIAPEAIQTCATHLRQGDPDRFLAVMAAPPAVRAGLFALYAFNLEVARALWVTREPLLAQMRLQYWRDVVTGDDRAPHVFADPLRAMIAAQRLDPARLLCVIDAREAEIGNREPFADQAALWRYLEQGAGSLLVLAVQALGLPTLNPVADPAVTALGAAQGLANYLMAVPALAAAGRLPLPDGRPEAVAGLAREGLARIAGARSGLRALPKPARPALLAAWRAPALLAQAARDPARVGRGELGQAEFARRAGLLWRTLVGF